MSSPLDRSGERARRFYRENPFEGVAGQNPYAEPQPGQPASDNPYTSPAARGDEPKVRPAEYEMTLPPRGWGIFWLGLVGFTGAALSSPSVWLALSWEAYFAWLALASLAASLPAVFNGREALRAMAAGAMSTENRTPARIGVVLGITGTIFSLLTATWIVLRLLGFGPPMA